MQDRHPVLTSQALATARASPTEILRHTFASYQLTLSAYDHREWMVSNGLINNVDEANMIAAEIGATPEVSTAASPIVNPALDGPPVLKSLAPRGELPDAAYQSLPARQPSHFIVSSPHGGQRLSQKQRTG